MTPFFLMLSMGCTDKTDNSTDTSTTEESTVDVDGDGYDENSDCNDNDASVFPGSVAESSVFCLLDADGDGYGDASAPAPYDPGTDCNDSDPNTHPGAAENESSTLCQTDVDGDGYGSATPADGAQMGEDHFDDDPALWIQPVQGTWSFGEVMNLVNNCEVDADPTSNQVDAGFTLTSTSASEFNITMEGSSDSIPCTIAGFEFSCTVPPTESQTEVDVLDTTVEVDLRFSTTINGTFVHSSSLSTNFVLTAECTDTDNLFISCSAFSDYLPCDASWTMPASYAQ